MLGMIKHLHRCARQIVQALLHSLPRALDEAVSSRPQLSTLGIVYTLGNALRVFEIAIMALMVMLLFCNGVLLVICHENVWFL